MNKEQALDDLRLIRLATDGPNITTGLDKVWAEETCSGVLKIAIAGSDSPRDWASNFRTRQVYITNSAEQKASVGFVEAADEIDKRLWDLNLFHTRLKEIRLTGHSRGAAIAAILAVTMENTSVSLGMGYKVSLSGFGCPRFSKQKLSSEAVRTSTQWLVDGDKVGEIPPRFVDNGVRYLLGEDSPDRFKSKLMSATEKHLLSNYYFWIHQL